MCRSKSSSTSLKGWRPASADISDARNRNTCSSGLSSSRRLADDAEPAEGGVRCLKLLCHNWGALYLTRSLFIVEDDKGALVSICSAGLEHGWLLIPLDDSSSCDPSAAKQSWLLDT